MISIPASRSEAVLKEESSLAGKQWSFCGVNYSRGAHPLGVWACGKLYNGRDRIAVVNLWRCRCSVVLSGLSVRTFG